MKKAVKAIHNGMIAHTDNEVYLSKALERLGANAMTKDQEPDVGAAFIKFSIVTKELSALMKTMVSAFAVSSKKHVALLFVMERRW